MKKGLLLFSVLALSACGTAAGIQQDFRELAASVTQKTQQLTVPKKQKEAQSEPTELTPAKVASALDNPICPPVIVDPELDSLTEFYDEGDMREDEIVSQVHLARASSTCTPDGEFVSIMIDLAFDGKLGPKARRKSDDQPFFAYPYFIAVTDNDGTEIVKELFAASMTYDSDQNQQSIVETLRQRLPYANDGTLPPYQIHVGFQLTENQLFYNTSR